MTERQEKQEKADPPSAQELLSSAAAQIYRHPASVLPDTRKWKGARVTGSTKKPKWESIGHLERDQPKISHLRKAVDEKGINEDAARLVRSACEYADAAEHKIILTREATRILVAHNLIEVTRDGTNPTSSLTVHESSAPDFSHAVSIGYGALPVTLDYRHLEATVEALYDRESELKTIVCRVGTPEEQIHAIQEAARGALPGSELEELARLRSQYVATLDSPGDAHLFCAEQDRAAEDIFSLGKAGSLLTASVRPRADETSGREEKTLRPIFFPAKLSERAIRAVIRLHVAALMKK